MASNTKLGLALILVILGAFGFVVYKKIETQKAEVASIKPEGEEGDDSSTFGSQSEPFSDESDPDAHGARMTAAHQQLHQQNPALPGTHPGTQQALADPMKPRLLDTHREGEFTPPPQRPAPAAARPKPAFGDDLFAEDEPFERDETPAPTRNGADSTPKPAVLIPKPATATTAARPQMLPGNPDDLLTKPTVVSAKPAGRRFDGDAFAQAEPFEDEGKTAKTSEPADGDEFGDPFGGDGDEMDSHPARQHEPDPEPAAQPHRASPGGHPRDDGDFDAFESPVGTFEKHSPPKQEVKKPPKPEIKTPPKPVQTVNNDDLDWDEAERFSHDERGDDHRPDHGDDHGHDHGSPPKPDKFAKHGKDSFLDEGEPTWGQHGSRPGHRPPPPKYHDFDDAHPGAHAGKDAYVVQANDNFWSISRKLYGTARYFRVLAALNRDEVPDPEALRPGTRIVTPSKEFLEAHSAEILAQAEGTDSSAGSGGPGAGATVLTVGYYQDESGNRLYRVGPNDTLTEIADRHLGRASRWIQIFELNRDKLSSPNDLHVGMELQLPHDARRRDLLHTLHDVR